MKLGKTDLELLASKGLTEETLLEQLSMLRSGFPYLKLECAATPGHGITVLSPRMEEGSIRCWEQFLAQGGKVMKMVPASGAASRMFKDLYAFLNGSKAHPDNDFMRRFFDNVETFAFFPALNRKCVELYGLSVTSLIGEKRHKDVVRALIEPEGLNYGKLPKALLEFHMVLGDTREALEEHLAEGAQYASSKGKVNVHFTVSEEHLPLVKLKVEEAAGHLGNIYDREFEVSYSVQKPSTDTVAANLDGTPYRENGKLFFRPGGHGALIENLNDLDADVIFIKNIDNVVPDSRRESTIRNKQVLGGTLVAVKQRIDEYCRAIEDGKYTEEDLEAMIKFLRDVLNITHDKTDCMTSGEKKEYVFGKLNRPVRVCGMVRNEGEPGGGPFLVYNADGTVSPQILESSQINMDNKADRKMLKEATHFNPVDLAVATRDFKGRPFDLKKYVDRTTGFISQKSREGVEIKALELPGLWNGAMSDWNTIFIEVPADTFNPVKTVNDLLREAHQPAL